MASASVSPATSALPMQSSTQVPTTPAPVATAFPSPAIAQSPVPAAKSLPPVLANPGAAATKSTAAATTSTERAIPFHGVVSVGDPGANTFSIAGKEHTRVFKITEKTVITKAGNPATMQDVTANEQVRGSYWKQPDGTLEAKTVKLGPLTAEEEANKPKKKAK